MTNEQKAHDFAIAVLPKLIDLKIEEAKNDGTGSGIDIFKVYQETYLGALNAFEKAEN